MLFLHALITLDVDKWVETERKLSEMLMLAARLLDDSDWFNPPSGIISYPIIMQEINLSVCLAVLLNPKHCRLHC